jgi:hypothetical protein
MSSLQSLRHLYECSPLVSFPLRPADVTLRAYKGQPIECLGCITIPVTVGQVKLPQFTFYVTSKGDSMMGVDLFDALGGKVQLGRTRVVNEPAGVASISPDLSPSSQPSLSSVKLSQFPALTAGLGRLRGFVHRPMIDPSVKPIQQRLYHQPLALRQPISDELRRLEREGVIERIDTSPWLSNIVVARKKDNSVRLCVNLSKANQALIPERYPLPTMEEITERVAGSTVFSKIDLSWGYLQLELAEECRYLTAFITHDGVFQWRSLPFGLASGPSAFHQVVRRMVAHIDGCANLLDDLIIWGATVEEHDRRLRQVLTRLQQYGATVRVDKCVLGAKEVEFNGHHLSAAGIRPLTSNVEAIQRIPVPTNQRQFLWFLATASYYLKFVQGFARLSESLRQLMKPEAEWVWSPDCQRAFQLIKDRIASKPVLAHFDVTASTIVTCDSSATALGACLSQRKNGIEHPVAFASRVLTPAERKYSASEREALACVWACERWHFFLYGRRFTLVTDHQALKTLLTAGGIGHRPLRLHRWCDRLYQYNFEVVYKPGSQNVVADTLSRCYEDTAVADACTPANSAVACSSGVSDVNIPVGQSAVQAVETGFAAHDDDVNDEVTIQTIFGSLGVSVVSLQQVADATDADQYLPSVRRICNFRLAG